MGRVENPPLAGPLAPILRGLAEQSCLKGEDVVEDSIDAPPLEAVVGDHAGTLEEAPKRRGQWAIDPGSSVDLRFLEELKAAIERELPQPVAPNAHVPSTSTLPTSVTRTLTTSSDWSP